jgi:hypothetical protein
MFNHDLTDYIEYTYEDETLDVLEEMHCTESQENE